MRKRALNPKALWALALAAALGAGCSEQTPGIPTGLIAKAGDSQVSLAWQGDLEVPVQSYTMTWGPSATQPSQSVVLPASPQKYVAHGLTNGIQYFFAVSALGASGQRSAPCSPVSATPNGSLGTNPPTLIATVPADGATTVALTTPFQVDFSGAMNTTSVQIAATPPLNFGPLTWVQGDSVANFQTPSALAPGVLYTLTVTGQDAFDTPLAAGTSYSFNTVPPPSVINTTPDNGSSNVTASTAIFVQFSEAMDPGTSGFPITVTPDFDWDEVWYQGNRVLRLTRRNFTLNPSPPVPLQLGTHYVVTVAANASSSDGVPLTAPFSFSFNTSATADTTAPMLVGISPANGDTAATTDSIGLTFSEPMNEVAVFNAFSITDPASGEPAFDLTWNQDSTVFFFTPLAPYIDGTAITYQVTTTATDVAGNALDKTYSDGFTPQS